MSSDTCIHLVNYDVCSLFHCTCNGCMECKDHKVEEDKTDDR